MTKCIFECGREIKPLSKLKACQTCRSAMGTAIRKGAAWFVNRTHNLKLYLARTENVMKGKKKVW
jgi:hypothetical protein